MRSSVTFKLAVLLPVIFATWFVTSSIIAQHATGNKSTSLQKLAGNEAIPQASPAKSRSVGYAATFHLKNFDINVQDDEVRVAASVAMMARTQDSIHLWRMRAYRAEGDVLELDKPYTEQAFEIHPSGQMSPAFSESFQLPVGKHRILLSLYQVPKGYDLSELNDEDKALAATVISGAKTIEIR